MRSSARAFPLGGILLTVLELLAHGSVGAPATALDGVVGAVVLADVVRGRLAPRPRFVPEVWGEGDAVLEADDWSESDFDTDDEDDADLKIDWPEFERAFATYARDVC